MTKIKNNIYQHKNFYIYRSFVIYKREGNIVRTERTLENAKKWIDKQEGIK